MLYNDLSDGIAWNLTEFHASREVAWEIVASPYPPSHDREFDQVSSKNLTEFLYVSLICFKMPPCCEIPPF